MKSRGLTQQALDVVVPCSMNPERSSPVAPLARKKQLLSVPERHHFVPSAVDDEHGRLDVFHSVAIRKQVARQSEAKVERYAKGAEKGGLQDHSRARRALLG